jgi:succinyl-CoA synthetase alpha subunit
VKSPLRRVCSGLVLLATTASFGLLTTAGTAQAKKDALEAAGVKVGKTPSETAQLMKDILASR